MQVLLDGPPFSSPGRSPWPTKGCCSSVNYRFFKRTMPEVMRQQVTQARRIQEERLQEAMGIHFKMQLTSQQMRDICRIGQAGHTLLKNAMEKLNLPVRAYDRILKVPRVITDLDSNGGIRPEHLAVEIRH